MSLNTQTMKTLLVKPTAELAKKFKALDHDTRYRIVSFLLENGESKFKDVSTEVTESKAAIAYHLDILVNSGLLEKRYEREGREYSHYRVSDDAVELFSKLGLTV